MSQPMHQTTQRGGYPAPSKHFMVLAALMVGSWLATVVVEPLRVFVEAHLVITATSMPQLELWSALTHAFFPRDFLMLFFNVLMLYFFAMPLERRWGLKKWWAVALVATLLGGAAALPVAWLVGSKLGVSGFAAAISAFVAAYCWRHWDQRMNFFMVELTGKTLLALFVGLDVLFALFSLDPTQLALRLVATLTGLVMAQGVADVRMRWTRWRVRRKLKVVRAPEDKKRDTRKLKDGTWLN